LSGSSNVPAAGASPGLPGLPGLTFWAGGVLRICRAVSSGERDPRRTGKVHDRGRYEAELADAQAQGPTRRRRLGQRA